MLKMALVAVVALSLLGCDGGEPGADQSRDAGSTNPVIGTWLLEESNSAIRLRFDPSAFELSAFLLLTDGSFGMQIDRGTYAVAGSKVNVLLEESSCQGVKTIADPSKSWPFTRDGNSLSLDMGSAYLVFQAKTTPPAGMGGATIGCFKDDGTFVAHPVTALP